MLNSYISELCLSCLIHLLTRTAFHATADLVELKITTDNSRISRDSKCFTSESVANIIPRLTPYSLWFLLDTHIELPAAAFTSHRWPELLFRNHPLDHWRCNKIKQISIICFTYFLIIVPFWHTSNTYILIFSC